MNRAGLAGTPPVSAEADTDSWGVAGGGSPASTTTRGEGEGDVTIMPGQQYKYIKLVRKKDSQI